VPLKIPQEYGARANPLASPVTRPTVEQRFALAYERLRAEDEARSAWLSEAIKRWPEEP